MIVYALLENFDSLVAAERRLSLYLREKPLVPSGPLGLRTIWVRSFLFIIDRFSWIGFGSEAFWNRNLVVRSSFKLIDYTVFRCKIWYKELHHRVQGNTASFARIKTIIHSISTLRRLFTRTITLKLLIYHFLSLKTLVSRYVKSHCLAKTNTLELLKLQGLPPLRTKGHGSYFYFADSFGSSAWHTFYWKQNCAFKWDSLFQVTFLQTHAILNYTWMLSAKASFHMLTLK